MSLRYLSKRLMYTLFVFLFVVTFNFVLFRLMPGDPIAMLSREVSSNPEARAVMEHLYGLDKPLPLQFVDYLKSMITFDFGESFQYRAPVWDVLKDKIGNTLILELAATPLSILIGVMGGIIAGSHHGSKLDIGITSVTMLVYAVPSFWLAMVFLLYFGVKLGWAPFNGMVTAGVHYSGVNAKYLADLFRHLAIPTLSYALANFGSYLMIMRGSMIDVYGEDYVLTARAKGLTERQVRRRHIVPNAMLPTANMIVMGLAFMLTGAFSIEVLFTWPGMGRLMVDSVMRRDYPMLQATNYIVALMVIIANFVLDILYTYIDPRVKLE